MPRPPFYGSFGVSVTLNEAALGILLETEEGPVGRFVQRVAEDKIVDAMRQDVRSYFVGAETGVEDDVGLRMEGSTAVVGLQNDPQGRHTAGGESKSERYARLGRFGQTRSAAGQ
jgi:hypothetical protein